MKRIVLGLTGSTGAGKSTVSRKFAEKGFGIIDADEISRNLTKNGSPLLKVLANNFGSDIIKSDGSLDRSLLAKRAFSDRESNERLNSIVHPAVMSEIKKDVADFQSRGIAPLIDAPLLFEAGGDKLCNKIISVIAPVEIRCERIMKRDSISREAAMLRINAQPGDSFYTDRSDFVIVNSGTKEELIKKTEEIIDILLEAESNEKARS